MNIKAIQTSSENALKIILEKTESGFSAYAPAHSGIYTVGDSYEELKENIEEVIEYQVDYLKETGKNAEAEFLKNAKVEYFLDVKQFFEQYPILNKSEFANYIGMNASMMRKISSGIIPLSDAKAQQIQEGLHRLANDLKQIHFA
ncbi:Predicted nuclease of the RNAse H fold, HicB family [Algoriphagus alkaliphilus]|uniref:Predicted nuclease of the RNAse H fold, HicB family n=1 Tax=Algoriphagus alkaliphilus TaxID=279824 RepID=A0A1G5Z1W4_9BACT|nr:type II toxin-antitoxin system HicB family antitoxin [Algoriphagus alkaliphilus]MBA4299308.1 type II toxin-antitoxin system HicB family antitoxin [Cyclobacterium sp.]SDA88522.1 Predicted nuclease of the RNAse H fold, HicB family [Algoriphagus alkaliphilus]